MLYVSFIEIFVKSQLAFADDPNVTDEQAYLYATLCFFGGMGTMKFLDCLVSKLEPKHDERKAAGRDNSSSSSDVPPPSRSNQVVTSSPKRSAAAAREGTTEGCPPGCESCPPPPPTSPPDHNLHTACACDVTVAEIDSWQARADEEIARNDLDRSNSSAASDVEGGGGKGQFKGGENAGILKDSNRTKPHITQADVDQKLVRMGLNTALAIGIHNFPEGLATFVATLADPTVGVSLAVAIAIHNVPEGLCVSIPIFYATGDRRKAFLWALLSGVTEPIGALVGWALLRGVMGQVVYGVMFGLVSGMMTMIVLHELLPTALRYDPDDTVVTNCTVAGMAVMAFSLVLFVI